MKNNLAEVDLVDDGGDGTLEAFRLKTSLANSSVEITREDKNVWLVKITEANGTINDIHFSSDTEILASIVSD